MRQSRFSNEQIISMIKEQEAGMPASEVCRKHGISTASFYKYKAKFGGMEVSDARKLKALEDENSCLLYTSPSPRDQRGSRMPSSA